MMCPAEHRHAEASTCYIIHKCRCDSCRQASTDRARQRRRLQAYGRWDSGLVEAEPVREHLRMLSRHGIGWKRAAELAGVSKTVVGNLLYGRKGERRGEVAKRIRRESASAILAVQPGVESLRPGALVPTLGVRRRVEALACAGYSASWIARQIGRLPGNFIVGLERETVTVKTAQLVAEVFDKYAYTQRVGSTHAERAGITRTVTSAKRRGFVPAAAWDDIDLDEAPADGVEVDVDEVAVELALSGRPMDLNADERRELVARGHARGLSDTEIARRSGLNVKTVSYVRGRLGLPANSWERAA